MSAIKIEQGSPRRRRWSEPHQARRWGGVAGKLEDLWWAGLDRGRRLGPDGIRWATILGVLMAVLLISALPVIDKYWPYRYRNVKPLLENVLASQITIRTYHRTYFPSPGFVADGVTLRRRSALDLPPLGTVDHVRVEGSWLDLLMLRARVQLVELDGMKLEVPAQGTEASRREFPAGSSADFGGPTTAIVKLRVHGARLDIVQDDGSGISFPVEELVMRGLQQGKPVRYAVDMENAEPSGQIHATGSFGPINTKDLGATPVSDDFTFTQVKLSDLGHVRGTLNAHGRFGGTLEAIAAEASAEAPDFAVGSGRAERVKAEVRCTIDGLNGNVALQGIALTIGSTALQVSGSVAGSPKVTDLNVRVPRGRAQDLLGVFLEDKPPIRGVVSMSSHVRLAPGSGDFFSRLQVDGHFDVPAEEISDPGTEQSLSSFSQRAQGTKQEDVNADADVLSSLAGDATLRGGVLHTSRLVFAVPGATANRRGSYSLRDRKVDLTGDLRTDADISHVTTGFGSVLLKPFAPLFARKHAGAVIPIRVSGAPGSYKAGPNLVP
jgi:hypothetical protein